MKNNLFIGTLYIRFKSNVKRIIILIVLLFLLSGCTSKEEKSLENKILSNMQSIMDTPLEFFKLWNDYNCEFNKR